MTDVRESHLVELVDTSGHARGAATVSEAHQAPGALHRAFSVILVDDDGRVLLQQRAATKTRFAGRWANTCCGHPAPGVTVTDAARARLREELGATVGKLNEIGVYVYRAEDPATGRVEHEYDHVLLGSVPADLDLDPDPAEVAATRWVTEVDLRETLGSEPERYAPWLAGAVALLPREPDEP